VIRALRFWLTFEGRVDRRTYLRHGLMLMMLKYAGDVVIVGLLAGTLWTPVDYFSSVDTLLTGRLVMQADATVGLVLWTLPFMWTGVTMTVRRAIDTGWSGWIAALMLLLSARPTRVRSSAVLRPPDAGPFPLGMAIGAGAVVGIAMMVFTARVAASYSAPLFIGTPFMMGAMTSFVANRRWPQPRLLSCSNT